MFTVEWGGMKPTSKGGYAPPAFRVVYQHGGGKLAFRAGFARKVDAETGLKALTAAGITSREKALELGLDRCNQIMCEALPW